MSVCYGHTELFCLMGSKRNAGIQDSCETQRMTKINSKDEPFTRETLLNFIQSQAVDYIF